MMVLANTVQANTVLANILWALAKGLDQASEALPSPTLLVVLYATLWLGLVGWIAWMATGQHRVDAEAQALGRQLQARLDRDDRKD